MTLRTEMLFTLCLQYKQDKDCAVFTGMLERADKLLLDVIYKLRKIKPHLGAIELNDLYQSAIVGLHRAALTAKESETHDQMVARIIAYVRSEINTTYPLTKTKRFPVFQRLDFSAEEYVLDNRAVQTVEDIEHRAQLNMLQNDYAIMLKKGVISREDFQMFVRHIAYGESCKSIADKFDKPVTTVQYRVKKTLKRVREYFKDWEI